MLSNWKNEIPLVLIVGSKCSAAPVVLVGKLTVDFYPTSVLCDGLVSSVACLGFSVLNLIDGSVSLIHHLFKDGNSDLRNLEKIQDGGLVLPRNRVKKALFRHTSAEHVPKALRWFTHKDGCV